MSIGAFSWRRRSPVSPAFLVLGLVFSLVVPAGQGSASPENPTLRELADAKGLWIGATASSIPPYWNMQEFVHPAQVVTLCTQFNAIMPTNALKWEAVHPLPDVYNFAPGDMFVRLKNACRMAMYGHALVLGFQLPRWLTSVNRPEEEVRGILRDHIFTVMQHFQLSNWDVVLEAFNADGSYAQNYWYQEIGPEYIELAFRWAQEADPNANLWYNDFGTDTVNQKSDAILNTLSTLVNQGVKVSGVGFQMHLSVCPPLGQGCPASKNAVITNLRRFSQAGFEVRVPAVAVRLSDTGLTALQSAQALQEQATVFRERLEACLAPDVNCKRFSTLGVSDLHAYWIRDTWPGSCCPLLFDEEYLRKRAYFGVRYALLNYQP